MRDGRFSLAKCCLACWTRLKALCATAEANEVGMPSPHSCPHLLAGTLSWFLRCCQSSIGLPCRIQHSSGSRALTALADFLVSRISIPWPSSPSPHVFMGTATPLMLYTLAVWAWWDTSQELISWQAGLRGSSGDVTVKESELGLVDVTLQNAPEEMCCTIEPGRIGVSGPPHVMVAISRG